LVYHNTLKAFNLAFLFGGRLFSQNKVQYKYNLDLGVKAKRFWKDSKCYWI